MTTRVDLAKVTGDDLSGGDSPKDVSDYTQVLNPAPPSRGLTAPPISDAAQALLIMYGLQAQFTINYFRVTRRKEPGQFPVGVHVRPGQKYRMSTGVSAYATFEEWQKALRDFAGELT
jgi:hypothetical protein